MEPLRVPKLVFSVHRLRAVSPTERGDDDIVCYFEIDEARAERVNGKIRIRPTMPEVIGQVGLIGHAQAIGYGREDVNDLYLGQWCEWVLDEKRCPTIDAIQAHCRINDALWENEKRRRRAERGGR